MIAWRVWRQELQGLIPRGFLRRDQEEALFVSDYPRFGEEAAVTANLLQAGYTVRLHKTLVYLDGGEEKYRRLIRETPPCPLGLPDDGTLPLWSLACRLVQSPVPPEIQPLPALRLTLKYLDAEDFGALYRALAPEIARTQREGRPLPSAAGAWILSALTQQKGDVTAC